MSIQAILLPLFVEVALTFTLLFWMGFARVGAIKRKETKMTDIALGQSNWPPRVQQISNCYHNQFQLPVLFYALTILVIMTRHADFVFVAMAWLFVLTRLLHAYIHTGSNFVRHRFNAFLLGAVILLAMWVIFAVRILLGLP
ncbi:MAG: MAPEG family protein [Rhizobiales bacterium]|nr:MAPEG family protein [Hyphomicrobiales bacterium]